MIYIDSKRCNGCGECLDACPTGAITMQGMTAVIEENLCKECAVCLEVCPQGAILAIAPMTLQPAGTLAQDRPRLRDLALPAVGSALIWSGREILPRLASLALNWLDRRSRPTGRASLLEFSAPARNQGVSGQGGHCAPQRRQRHRGGR